MDSSKLDRIDARRTAVRVVVAAALLAMSALQHAGAQPIAGLWQVHEGLMWIQVNVDRSTLRCRFIAEDSALVVRGVLESANAIKWKSALGTEEVEFRRDSLAARSSYGVLTLEPAQELMPSLCRAPSPSNDSNAAVGLWRMPGRSVWIQIDSDGSTLKCGTLSDATVVAVKGVLETPRSIKWTNAWGIEPLDTRDGSLLVKARFGDETFEPAEVPMPPQCRRQAGG